MITSQLYYHCTKQAFMEISVGIEPTIKELQSFALPLGYGTIFGGQRRTRTFELNEG